MAAGSREYLRGLRAHFCHSNPIPLVRCRQDGWRRTGGTGFLPFEANFSGVTVQGGSEFRYSFAKQRRRKNEADDQISLLGHVEKISGLNDQVVLFCKATYPTVFRQGAGNLEDGGPAAFEMQHVSRGTVQQRVHLFYVIADALEELTL